MDNNLMVSILQILGIMIMTGGIIFAGYKLKGQFGSGKVDDTIDSVSKIVNIITSLLVSNNFGDEATITKVKFIIYETLQMIKGVENMPDEDLVRLGIRNIKKMCVDNDIKLTDAQCEIAKSCLELGMDYIKKSK